MENLTLDSTIEEMQERMLISVRLFHCLRTARLRTLADIIKHHDTNGGFDSMMSVQGFGRKMLTEIENFLQRYQSLGAPAREVEAEAQKTREDGKSMDQRYADFLESLPVDEPSEILRKLCPDFASLLVMVEGEQMPKVDGLGIDGHRQLWEMLRSAVGILSAACPRQGFGQARQVLQDAACRYTREGVERSVFMFNLSMRRNHRFDQFMQSAYGEVLSRHSTRAQNRLREAFPTYISAIEQAFKGRVAVSELRNAGVGSIHEINEALVEIRQVCAHVLSLKSGDLNMQLLRQTYDFLTDEQTKHIIEFNSSHGYYPMVWALYQLVMGRDDVRVRRFRALHGVGEPRVSPMDYAMNHNLTYERARQLRNFGPREIQHPLLASADWNAYPGIDKPFYTMRSPIFARVRTEEELSDLSFDGFGALLSLVEPLERFEVRGYPYYISSHLFSLLRVRPLVMEISRVGCHQDCERLLVPLENMVTPLLKTHMSTKNDKTERDAMELAAAIAQESFGMEREDDALVSPRRVVNVRREICEIIAEHGKPMHIDELVAEFMRRHPDHSTNSPSRMRAYIQMTPQVVCMGKSSTYVLASWKDRYYTGTIRDCVIEVLQNSPRMMSVREIAEEVSKHFPRVTINSLAASISSCRNVERRGHYVGLRGKEYPLPSK